MNKKTCIFLFLGIVTFSLFLAPFFFGPRLHSQAIRIITLPRISGWAHVQAPSLFAVYITITSGGTPITMATVRVDDSFNVPHSRDGIYSASTAGYSPIIYNMPIKISIKSPLRTEPEIFAGSKVSALVQFISPKPDELIDLRTTEYVKVQWKYAAGSATVEKLLLDREGVGGDLEFTGIGAATRYEISRDRLVPNSTYRLILLVALNNFRFKDPGLVDSSSRITLTMKVNTSFRTAP
jgi:hypothetical protein